MVRKNKGFSLSRNVMKNNSVLEGLFPETEFSFTKIMSSPAQENHRQVLDSVSCKKFDKRIILLMNFFKLERCVESLEQSLEYSTLRITRIDCLLMTTVFASRDVILFQDPSKFFPHSHQRQFFNRKTHIYSSLSLTCLIKFVKDADDPMD